MRVLALFASLLVLSAAALRSSGTVNFNFIWIQFDPWRTGQHCACGLQ